jgi:hypothetical protein
LKSANKNLDTQSWIKNIFSKFILTFIPQTSLTLAPQSIITGFIDVNADNLTISTFKSLFLLFNILKRLKARLSVVLLQFKEILCRDS